MTKINLFEAIYNYKVLKKICLSRSTSSIIARYVAMHKKKQQV